MTVPSTLLSRPLAVAVATVIAVGAALAAASPASADLVDPPGVCAATGTWQNGGRSVDSLTSDPAEVIDIPRADSVAWTGRADGPPAGAGRPVAGNLALRLPPPMGWFTVREWSGTGSNVAAAGTDRYDLPGVVPAGVVFELRAEHYEGEELFCRGSAQLRIPGGPGPLAWVALALAVLLAAPLVLVGRGGGAGSGRRAGRAVGGALLGSLAGGVAGLVLVLFGVVPLASPVVTAAAAVGLLGGGAWAVWAPLGSGTPAGQPAGGAQ